MSLTTASVMVELRAFVSIPVMMMFRGLGDEAHLLPPGVMRWRWPRWVEEDGWMVALLRQTDSVALSMSF
jgi:hypothetical protein